MSVLEKHFILKINGYHFAAAARARSIMYFSFFKSSPRSRSAPLHSAEAAATEIYKQSPMSSLKG